MYSEKKLLLAAFGVAGLVSASVPTKSKTLEYSKFELASDLNLEGLTSVVECRVYESSCGEAGFFCRENVKYEEFVEFGYLVEDAFCGGCYIDC